MRKGFGGYVGWSPTEALANFQQTGGAGKETQQTPPGYQFQSQVLGAQAPQNWMQQGMNAVGNAFNGAIPQAYDWASQQAQNVGNAFLPVAAKITQQFGIKSPYDVFSKNINTGTDFAVPQGTPVIVPSGRWRVIHAFNQAGGPGFIGNGTNNGYGNSVMLQNLDTNERLRFSHLSQVGVKPGDIVGGGAVGLSGSTGNASGPHLDVEYYDAKGKLGDPLKSPYMQQKLAATGHVTQNTFEPPKPVKGPDGQQQAAAKPNPYLQNQELTKMFLAPVQKETTPSQTPSPSGQNPFELGVPVS